MTPVAASIALVAHIALLSAISFGGVPGILPDLRDFVVDRHGWLSNQDFANYFAIVQALPGPNMIMMMSFIGWKVGGLPTAIASAVVTFAPPCAFAAVVFRWFDRFRDMPWHGAVRRGLAPVTLGLVIAGGAVMGWTGGVGWHGNRGRRGGDAGQPHQPALAARRRRNSRRLRLALARNPLRQKGALPLQQANAFWHGCDTLRASRPGGQSHSNPHRE